MIAYISKKGLLRKEPYRQTIIVYKGNSIKFEQSIIARVEIVSNHHI